MENKNENENIGFESLFNIARAMIGFDLTPIKPMDEKEVAEWNKKLKEENNKWEAEHPEQVKARNEWKEKYSKKKPYTLTADEREIVKELLNTDDDGLDSLSIEIYPDGELCVSTPQQSWFALAGREWCINLKNKTHRLTAMS